MELFGKKTFLFENWIWCEYAWAKTIQIVKYDLSKLKKNGADTLLFGAIMELFGKENFGAKTYFIL